MQFNQDKQLKESIYNKTFWDKAKKIKLKKQEI